MIILQMILCELTSRRPEPASAASCRAVPRSLLGRGRHENDGVAALEFAILVPVLVLLIFGGLQFAYTLNNYEALSSATRAGVRQLALSRGGATPLTDTQNQIYANAPNLTRTSFTITLAVNGTTCASDSACSTALVAGVPATVTTSYPCSLQVGGINFAPSCTLGANSTERVE